MTIPFNSPAIVGTELEYLKAALDKRHLSGDGDFTRRCHAKLESVTGAHKALLTHSCTAALEMAAMLSDVGPGDEVIMPSFTFVSTASNAFVLRGAAVPGVPSTFAPTSPNLDERLDSSPTRVTKAARRPSSRFTTPAAACEMDRDIGEIASRNHDLVVVEDAAQGVGATWRGRALGTLGSLGCLSFHETKNVVLCAVEGGALLINDERFVERAERFSARREPTASRVLSRAGRQVHVGRHRIVVPAE